MSYDFVVAGAGIGGLVAARSAQEHGARVLVIEKADRIGGSAAASGGTVWCARDINEWLKVQPDGDTELGQALIDSFEEGIEWLTSQGVVVTPVPDRPYKFLRNIYRLDPDPRTALTTLYDRIQSEGGEVLCQSTLRDIFTQDGRIDSVYISTSDGDRRIETLSLVLATGGFQANPELRARYMGRWADRMIVRGVPENTGDAFEAALRIGASTAGAFGRFYGHYLPAAPAQVKLHNFVLVKPDFSEYAVTVNLLGERFDDEFLGDEVTVHALIHQPEGMGVLVFDQHIRSNMEQYSQWPTADVDRVVNIRDAGGEVLENDTLRSLAAQMASKWGVPPGVFLETIEGYNTACEADDASMLSIPKSGGLIKIAEPPFYAIRVVAGVTFTYGGVKVDSEAQVLDRSGGPIGGLYAAGADCGGIYTRGYTGGLSMGLAFGRLAGRNAAAYARRNS